MQEIQVVNVKCWGCATTVSKELERLGVTDIEVCFWETDSSKTRTIRFEGDTEAVKDKLSELGYPEVGSKEALSLLKKAKSFMSCAIGKMN